MSKRLLAALSLLLVPIHTFAAADSISLAGRWRLQLDPGSQGVAQQWFARSLDQNLTLPGSLQGNGFGDVITRYTKWTGSIVDRSWFTAPGYEPYRQSGNIKVPFWLQPETHYVGAAWYQRDVEIPAAWSGRRIVLTLERPHWRTTVWLDGREIGTSDAISVPHVYDMGTTVGPGRHVFTIRVDNTLDPDIGENSHSISDHTQGNWNGIVGAITLQATAPVWADNVQAYPDIATKSVRLRGELRNITGKSARGKISVQLASDSDSAGLFPLPVTTNFNTSADRQHFDLEFNLGSSAQLWDEFSPTVYAILVTVGGEIEGEPFEHNQVLRFGLREISHEGNQLKINGRNLFLRGTLDCAAFPRTGHPPTDVETWRTVLETIRAHGLNHVRFHSWCPPEAAFTAADELGVYLQVEVASWPNQSTTLGDGKPVDGWIDAETTRIVRAYGNHPSFVLFCCGNEPGGDNHVSWLSDWVARQKAADSRRIHTAGAGWPEVPENDFHVPSAPRIQHWGEGLASRINRLPPETRTDYADFVNERTVPVISHEIGQWCVYPNFAEMSKYTGYLKPRNFEIFRAGLDAHGMLDQARDFVIASGKLQALCYKEDIESALRTPRMGGFQLLSLSDFPGQGTALVGVLDAFWEDKGYIAPGEFRRFCDATVLLARLDKLVFTADEHFVADVEVGHYGATPLHGAGARWELRAEDGHAVAGGSFETRTISIGAGNPLGRVDLALATLPAPARYTFAVALEGTAIGNDWDIWVYPNALQVVSAAPKDVVVVSRFDAATRTTLENGGTVWLQLPPAKVAPDPEKGPIAMGFSSIFWNTAWTRGQAPHTLGILCDPAHPGLALFPTESHSNWQWWYVMSNAAPMILDDLPHEFRPTVQVIDDWVTNRKLGLVLEARVGKGRLLVTSINLRDAVLDPVRRQLRASLLAYVSSEAFDPVMDVPPEKILALIAE